MVVESLQDTTKFYAFGDKMLTLERKGDGGSTDVVMTSTSSQHVPTPIGEHYL